jgi:predicted  nucleic acid-binding Zn-ribbon protein
MMSHIEMEYAKTLKQVSQLERELAEAKKEAERYRWLRDNSYNVQIGLERELAEAQEELNDKRKFCYAVEQALEGMKGDYVEIISALRKDAAMKEGK